MVALPADEVTRHTAEARTGLLDARPSLLPFDPKQLLALRMTRAQFAKACGVSRQSVSEWVRKGWVNIGADGRLDPVEAIRQLMGRVDPSRLRARIFREATASLGELRARIQSLEAEVAAERLARKQALHRDELARRISNFIDRLQSNAEAYWGAYLEGHGDRYLDLLTAEELLGFDSSQLGELRAMLAEVDMDSRGTSEGTDA